MTRVRCRWIRHRWQFLPPILHCHGVCVVRYPGLVWFRNRGSVEDMKKKRKRNGIPASATRSFITSFVSSLR